jgi:hypothetical protein
MIRGQLDRLEGVLRETKREKKVEKDENSSQTTDEFSLDSILEAI